MIVAGGGLILRLRVRWFGLMAGLGGLGVWCGLGRLVGVQAWVDLLLILYLSLHLHLVGLVVMV